MRFTQGLHRGLRHTPDAVATICEDRKTTFSQLHRRVARLASGLHAQGVTAGAKIAILAFNSDRYLEYYLAVPWVGAMVNPVNFRWTLDEITYSLNDSESSAIFLDEHFAPHAAALRERCPCLRLLVFSGNGKCPEGLIDSETLIERHEPIEDAGRGDDDLYGVFYTGGTTGRSKGVLLSHRNLCTAALGIMTEGLFPNGAIGLHAAPMFHLADMMMTAGLLLRGGTHVMAPAFKPDVVLRLIAEHHITDLLLVPAMLQAVVDYPDFARFDTGSVQRLIYGASPASEALLDRAMRALPNVAFGQGYGMTEIAATATFLPHAEHDAATRSGDRLRAAGRAYSHLEVRIANEQDEELPRREIGEILVRGPNVMHGYLNQPEASAAALRNGWMHSGDMGFMDEAGYVFIVDRLKDMIISGGENIYSVEVENAVAKHPSVAACAVIGIPSTEWGEAIHAAVVLKPGATLTLEALQAHCKGLFAGYKCPRSLELRESLPLSGAGKVLKTELRAPFWKDRGRAVN